MTTSTVDTKEEIEKLKAAGNKHFQESRFDEAIKQYSLALEEWRPTLNPKVKAVLLSNRAACYLKSDFDSCVEDCTQALKILEGNEDLRCKLLYRRAKAWFLISEVQKDRTDVLQDAAKDLLNLLSIDPTNKPAGVLLKTIRAKHNLTKGTPVSQTLQKILAAADETNRNHHCKVMMGLLSNDPSSAIELGHLGGVAKLLAAAMESPKSLQVLGCACSNPRFVREFGREISQGDLAKMLENKTTDESGFALISIWLRLVLYLDPVESLDEKSLIDDDALMRSVVAAFLSPELLQASLDLVSSWTTIERPGVVQASTDADMLGYKKSVSDLRSMAPREVAAYKKQEYQRQERDKTWAKRRSLKFCRDGGLEALLNAAMRCERHTVRKQVGVGLGRIFVSIQDQEDVKTAVSKLVGTSDFRIEEISEEKEQEDVDQEQLHRGMGKALLVSSLLLGQAESGAWALGKIRFDLEELISSGNEVAMAIASEVVSAAAAVEKCRPIIAAMLNNGALEALLIHPESEVRSGAASAAAKLGLADKVLAANEGEVIGLLQIAVELLYSEDADASELNNMTSSLGITSSATTSIERGIEVLGYLAAKTAVKEEIAHGFRSPPTVGTSALERLVELACQPKAGEATSAFSLATIFSSISVSSQTLRREAFAGKDITMEQYDELQALGKTDEEKQLVAEDKDDDTPSAVEERIRKLATANVPRALVKLMEGASETCTEKIVECMSRMASEPSVRGLLIQQGVLTACTRMEQGVKMNEKEKGALRRARHCVGKLLVTTNPALLTTSQRMGAIKPLIQLVRDHEASDLQQFEALLAITNLACTGEESKEKIISEKGISTLSYAMFSDHELVRRAATEAMCNLVPHPAMLAHLANPENLRLWAAFAADHEVNFECSRAAAGCLAMATHDPTIAASLVGLSSFKDSVSSMMESGNLELMHRALVVLHNLVLQGGNCRGRVVETGMVAFCRAYVESYHDGDKAADLGFTMTQRDQMKQTVDLAKEIVASVDKN